MDPCLLLSLYTSLLEELHLGYSVGSVLAVMFLYTSLLEELHLGYRPGNLVHFSNYIDEIKKRIRFFLMR